MKTRGFRTPKPFRHMCLLGCSRHPSASSSLRASRASPDPSRPPTKLAARGGCSKPKARPIIVKNLVQYLEVHGT